MKEITNIDLAAGLRSRLLYTSIGLAIVVSVIFISVAFNLSTDLGESLESEHSNYQFLQLKNHITTLPNIDNNGFILNENDKKILLKKLDKDMLGVELWLNGQHIILRNDDLYGRNDEITQAIKKNTSSSGFIEEESNRLFWSFQYYAIDNFSLLVVSKTYALDKAVNYVINRLSITAFLTFWLTIWCALFLSALVTKRFEESNNRLKYLATHDVLTGLPNRTFLYQYALTFFHAQNIKSNSKKNTSLALYVIDLDKFKDINDTMGHLIGDELLKAISIRLIQLNEECEQDIQVMRYGGDEFVVWSEKTTTQQAITLAEKIVTLCRKPVELNNYQFETSVSVGVAFYPQDGIKLDELIKNADIAMYQAKKHRLGFQVFQRDLFTHSEQLVSLRGQLSAALKQKEFVLFYQPKVKLPHGNIVGVEALVRWQHPKEGLLTPNVFIDIVEQSMFVHEFTRYIIHQAIFQCRTWLDNNIKLRIAVNISPYNLMDPELVTYIAQQLKAYDLPAEYLEVELTENASMVSIEKTQEVFQQLRELGVKLSLDDFGTGMSSLAYVKQFNVDYIKIDRSFVTDMVNDKRDEAVIISMLVLCQKLNKLTIAEGVETAEQAEMLSILGCDYAQGYFYSKPLPCDEMTKLIEHQNITN